jgi:ABC-2 type transport system ATP-binding protein
VQSAIKINNLSVTLDGHFKALKSINLELPKAKIIGFIGPSGAGKTTLIRGIVGSLRISSGEIRVFDEPAGAPELRRQVNYMTQELSIYPDLSVRENLEYFVALSGLPGAKAKAEISNVLAKVDMTNKSDNLVSDLSSGQKQRVSLAVALIGSAELLVLDEPTVGLDPLLRANLWNLFDELAKQGTTLIISSHSMDEASRCDDLVLIRDGKLIAHSSPEELLKNTRSETVEESFLKLAGDKE